MKAEDTVIGARAIEETLGFPLPIIRHDESLPINYDDLYKLRLAQAEISLKAGRKEVVDWINSRHALSNERTELGQEWQAKLKEWGIEGEESVSD